MGAGAREGLVFLLCTVYFCVLGVAFTDGFLSCVRSCSYSCRCSCFGTLVLAPSALSEVTAAAFQVSSRVAGDKDTPPNLPTRAPGALG